MTDKQKEAIEIIIRERGSGHLSDVEFYTLMEFIIKERTETPYVTQPAIPWTTPQPLQPYYGGTADPVLTPPYRITCEFVKD